MALSLVPIYRSDKSMHTNITNIDKYPFQLAHSLALNLKRVYQQASLPEELLQ